ncbi:integrin alpha-X [Aplochiton taeniatus]
MYTGLSMAKASNTNFTLCSPLLAHECFGNSYLNSMCYQFNNKFQITSNFTTAFQECTKKTVDLVFLFDGSESMTTKEFEKNKDFILDIMTSLNTSSINFAAVQFSTNPRTVFNFKDYKEGNASDYLRKELHMKALTNTYEAIHHVLRHLFDNQSAGATPDSIKVLVIITDGEPSQSDRNFQSITESDNKTIIRFIIGVKAVSIEKLQSMASDPKINNTFHIKDYNGLTGILGNFQKKIFNIEGAKTALAVNLRAEMSQAGFSAIYHKDVLVLGSVGSNDWRGSLYETERPNVKERAIHDPELMPDSYMGYSVAAGEKNQEPIYFTGAPRSNHTGQIVLFTKCNQTWTVKERKEGDQIGSYFGAEVCSMDIDSDSNTDFLLVGAPMFHQPQERREGQVYVYMLNDKLELSSKLNVSVQSRGRFGAAISSLSDLNGDGLIDVAVGAPLEANHRGAVYIYLGDRHTGIRPMFSQRIMGETLQPQPQFFGQTLDGKIDLGSDELTDLVVGSRGTVFVFRPVLNLSADLHHHPSKINTNETNCLESKEKVLPMVTLTVCFTMVEATRSKAGALDKGLNISYTLDVDPVRRIKRGIFKDKVNSAVALTDQRTCFNHSVSMPVCVKDTLSPIVIQLNFCQLETQQSSYTGILNADSNTQAMVEIPFQKNCRENETCVAELEVDFNFVTSTLIVVDQSYFNLTVSLFNTGDDSYNTSLTLYYPPSLSFSMMFVEKATRSTLYSCNGLEGVLGRTTCGINLPVYRSGSTVSHKACELWLTFTPSG